MTNDLHQDDYIIINDALNEFDTWIRNTLGVDPAYGKWGEWRDGLFNGQPTKERRYGAGKKYNATLLFDNRSPKTGLLCPNGFVKTHGDEGTRKWSYKSTALWQRLNEERAPKPLTPAERAAIAERDRQEKEKARKRAEAFNVEVAAAWKADLNAYLNDSLPITESSTGIGINYLTRKRTAATPFLRLTRQTRSTSFSDGITQTIPASSLMIPLFDVLTGEITAFQWIVKASGKDNKRFRHGHELKNVVHWIGDPKGAHVVALAEGYSTAWTFHALTDIPTGSTCDAGQMVKTATALLSSKSFIGSIIVAADDDFITAIQNSGKNPGMRAAQKIKDLNPQRVYILPPPLPHTAILQSDLKDDAPSDWNDFLLLYGDTIARSAAEALRDKALAFFKE